MDQSILEGTHTHTCHGMDQSVLGRTHKSRHGPVHSRENTHKEAGQKAAGNTVVEAFQTKSVLVVV